MKSLIFDLKNISIIKILAEINRKKLSGLLTIKLDDERSIIEVWCWDNKIITVKGPISLIEKIEYYNWLKPKLLIALKNETLLKKPIGEKILNVYGLNSEQIQQLFQEQIKELYNLFSIRRGTIDFTLVTNVQKLPYLEMTGCEIKISTVISKGLQQYTNYYSEDFPETCLTINLTNSFLENIELEEKDLSILKFTNSNKTIKKISKELNLPVLEVQQRIYFLQLMKIVETSLTINTLLKFNTKKSLNSLNNDLINFEYQDNWKFFLIFISVLNLAIIFLTAGGLFEGGEKSLLNHFFRWRGTTANNDITIIRVDDEDIERFPTYPIADEYLAKTIQNIEQYEPIVIGMDIYRNIPQPPGHEKLLETYRNIDNLVGVKKIAGKKVMPATILAEKKQVAFSDLIADSDGIVRRSLISVEDNNGQIDLSLGAYLALFSLSQQGIKMGQIDDNKYILGKTTFQALNSQSGGYWQANDFNGLQILLNYQNRTSDFKQISFWDAYQNKISPELIRNKIVIISITADSKKDFAYTPFSKNHTGLAEPFPGGVIHANITAQLLNAARGEIPLLRVGNKFTEILLIIGCSFLGITIGIIGLELNVNITKINQQFILIIQIITLFIILLSLSYFCFLNGLWIPTIAPFLSAIVSILLISFQYKQELENLIYGDKTIKNANRKYFDKVFDRVFHNAKKQNQEICLILCRIQNQKNSKNDSDLKYLAKIINELKGKNDLLARYEANCLAVILQNVNDQETKLFLASIRKKITSQLKNTDLALGYAISKNCLIPMEFLMLAINNLKNIR